MKQIETKEASVVWELGRAEAQAINNALNEVCIGIDIEEFETRLGCSRRQLSDLLDQIATNLKKSKGE